MWSTWNLLLWLSLVHLQVELSVETLEVVTCGGSAGGVHPHLTQGAGQAYLAGGGGDLLILISQLLLDQCHRIVRLSLSLGPELAKQVLIGEVVHLVYRHGVGSPHLHSPGYIDIIGRGGAQLTKGGDVDRPWGSLWFSPWFVCGYRVGKGA